MNNLSFKNKNSATCRVLQSGCLSSTDPSPHSYTKDIMARQSLTVATYTLAGIAGPTMVLSKDAQASLWLDGQRVVAISPWGDYVALTLTERLVLIRTGDFAQITGHARALALHQLLR